MRKVFIAGIVLVGVAVAVGTGMTGGTPHSDIKTLFLPLDTEARTYLAAEPHITSQELDAFATYLVHKYKKPLSAIMDEVEGITGQPLSKERRETLGNLIVKEHLRTILQEHIPEVENATTIEIEPILTDGTDTYNVFYTPMAGVPYPIAYWVQVYPDVYGGSGYDDAGNYYNVNGNNDLYKVRAEYTSTWVKYTLYFRDEDHPDPLTDAAYDVWRLLYYGRIEDIESFTVENSTINFSGIWDNNKTYAEWWGQHGNKTRSYTTTVYVSNVWNHAVDTYDKNPSMSKVWWYTSW